MITWNEWLLEMIITWNEYLATNICMYVILIIIYYENRRMAFTLFINWSYMRRGLLGICHGFNKNGDRFVTSITIPCVNFNQQWCHSWSVYHCLPPWTRLQTRDIVGKSCDTVVKQKWNIHPQSSHWRYLRIHIRLYWVLQNNWSYTWKCVMQKICFRRRSSQMRLN